MIEPSPFMVARPGRGTAAALRRPRHGGASLRLTGGALAALIFAAVAGGAGAQEDLPTAEVPAADALTPETLTPETLTPEALTLETPRDLRPPAAAYAVVDARAIEAPLAGAIGDAARGEAIFLSDLTGGCVSCHAAPGAPRRNVAPRILRDRLPPMPLVDEPSAEKPEAAEEGSGDAGSGDAGAREAAAEDAAAAAEGRSTSTSRLAPRRGVSPPERPVRDPALQDASGSGDGDFDLAAEDAELDSGAADAEAVSPGGQGRRGGERDAPPLLPLPIGPDLSGVAARLSVGELRLAVVNPQIGRPGSRMPAYHHVSLALADRAPGLRQPWLSAQELEDVVAYLATLNMPAHPEAEPAPEAGPDAGSKPAPDTAK